ncbi:hypothetical protein MKX01_007846 [Papaver californicum]|nr:hypothetical protein MKX01_007846 [Papaver californicum]
MEDMGINHRTVDVNGIKMHVAEKGQGPVVLLVHGFLSLWYSWRHQILSLAVFVVGHDWGAIMNWYLCLFRPDRVQALVNLSVAFTPRSPLHRPIEEPGEMESEFARVGTETVLKKILSYHSPAPIKIPRDKGFAPEGPITLPSWLSEEDIRYNTTKYEKSGFTGGINYYRNLNANWELTAPWTGAQVKVPVKFIEYVHSVLMKKDVPFLQETVVLEGVGHFIMEERADEISRHIIDFLRKFKKCAVPFSPVGSCSLL